VIHLVLTLADTFADSLDNLLELFQGADDPALDQLQFWLHRKVELGHEFLVWGHVLECRGGIWMPPDQVEFASEWGEEGIEVVGKSHTSIEHG
jgi:hypothetical protein